MKRFFVLMPLLFLAFINVRSQTTSEVSDTVWTKYTYPASINAVKFTPDGKFLASGGDDGTPRLWNSETGELVREFIGSDKGIGGLDINNTGDLLAVVDGKSVITVWNLNTGEIVKSIDYYAGQTYKLPGQSIAFSHNGNYLASILAQISNSIETCDMYICSVNDWKKVGELHSLFPANHLAFSFDDKIMAISNIGIADNKYEIGLFGFPELSSKGSLEGINQYSTIYQSAFSPDGKYLASALSGTPDKVWKIADWKLYRSLGKSGYSQAVTFSPDSKYVIVGGGVTGGLSTDIYEIISGNLIYSYNNRYLYNNSDISNSIDVRKDMKYIAIGGYFGIYMLNAKWAPTSVKDNPVQITEPIIYPNPASDYIEIQPSEGSDIKIFNTFGEIELSVEQTSPSVHRIDVSNLSPGMYFIKIGNKVQKFVKL